MADRHFFKSLFATMSKGCQNAKISQKISEKNLNLPYDGIAIGQGPIS